MSVGLQGSLLSRHHMVFCSLMVMKTEEGGES